MKIGTAFPGAYLKAADLQGRRVQVVIERVEMEDIGGDQKPVLHFKGKDRGLVLNKTNANAVWGLTGCDDTDDWTGVAITLFPSKTDFQGKRVDCIRIDPPDKAQPKPKPQLQIRTLSAHQPSDSQLTGERPLTQNHGSPVAYYLAEITGDIPRSGVMQDLRLISTQLPGSPQHTRQRSTPTGEALAFIFQAQQARWIEGLHLA